MGKFSDIPMDLSLALLIQLLQKLGSRAKLLKTQNTGLGHYVILRLLDGHEYLIQAVRITKEADPATQSKTFWSEKEMVDQGYPNDVIADIHRVFVGRG